MYLRILFKGILNKYDYHELGIIGDPYLDIYFKDVFYLTDTGRCSDGYKLSFRDKVVISNIYVKSKN